MSRKKGNFLRQIETASVEKNLNTFYYWLNRMCEIWLSCLKFDNLPASINLPYLKKKLMLKGYVCIFKDSVLGLLALEGAVSGVDIYDEPVTMDVHTASGYHANLTNENCVVVYVNNMKTIPFRDIVRFALTMRDIDMTIGVNVNAQKTPKIFFCSDAQKLTMMNFLQKWSGYVPVMLTHADNELAGEEETRSIDMTAPYVADKLTALKHDTWNEFLTWCGITSVNSDKKERLVSGEAYGTDGCVEMERNNTIETLEYYLKKVNEMFDTDISIQFNSNINVSRETFKEKNSEEDIANV